MIIRGSGGGAQCSPRILGEYYYRHYADQKTLILRSAVRNIWSMRHQNHCVLGGRGAKVSEVGKVFDAF